MSTLGRLLLPLITAAAAIGAETPAPATDAAKNDAAVVGDWIIESGGSLDELILTADGRATGKKSGGGEHHGNYTARGGELTLFDDARPESKGEKLHYRIEQDRLSLSDRSGSFDAPLVFKRRPTQAKDESGTAAAPASK